MCTIKIEDNDNVVVDINTGHKIAERDIMAGENIIKYGYPIGHALSDIQKGDIVHVDNLKTNLSEILTYSYTPNKKLIDNWHKKSEEKTDKIDAYVRENGDIGIRNDIWIINTVGCVNKTAQLLAKTTGALTFPHPFGCSQLGDDHETTRLILRGLVNHPNAGGVLVLGLGCENNTMKSFKMLLGEVNPQRVKFLVLQEVADEINEGVRLIKELQKYANTFHREPVCISRLKVGLKCGGSDGFSGITANPLAGQFSDKLISKGGSTVLTEVPEMFGAETIFMNRCISNEVFHKTVRLINDYKHYFISHKQEIYENPSPGNKAGGISTLEDKSLGCTQKGGSAPVVDVLKYGEVVKKNGLNLLDGPGNDIVAITNLTAAGCHLILFTTGRGTPVGAPIPTIKISSNTILSNTKPHWIDFDAGAMLNGIDLCDSLYEFVCKVAGGQRTNNEKYGYQEISIFKDGVIL